MNRAHRPLRYKILLAFAAVYIIWGSTYLAIKIGVETIPPFFMAGTRFLIAGALLYFFARHRGAGPPTRRNWVAAAAIGAMLLLCGNGSLVWSEQRVPSGLAALLLATIPIWMVLLDGFVSPDGHGTKLNARILGGLAIGIIGLALLVGPAKLWGSSRVDLAGAGILMFGSFSWSVGSLLSRRAKLPPSPFLAAAMEMLAGGALLVMLGFLTGEADQVRVRAISGASLLGLAYLIVFGSLLGFTAYMWLLSVCSTARVATYAYVNPAVAVLLGWAFAGEEFSARTLMATLAIVGAVALILSHRPQPGAIAPDTEGLPTEEESEVRSRESEGRIQKSGVRSQKSPSDPTKEKISAAGDLPFPSSDS